MWKGTDPLLIQHPWLLQPETERLATTNEEALAFSPDVSSAQVLILKYNSHRIKLRLLPIKLRATDAAQAMEKLFAQAAGA